MRTERIYPYQLEDGDLIMVRPKDGEPYIEPIVDFKRTSNAVAYKLGGQFYHFATVGRAREGVCLTRVVLEPGDMPATFPNVLSRLEKEVCERSDGNPGAINVMCVGILTYGEAFYRGIERKGLRGSAIWTYFKDQHDQSLSAMMEALKVSPPGSGLAGLLDDVKRADS